MKIVAWSINVVYEDESEEIITDVPNFVASAVDEFLNQLEEEQNENT